jgi:hypothetical protein
MTNLSDVIFESITTGGVLIILGFIFKYHKIWIRLLDRVDYVYKQFCRDHNIPFKGLRNGNGE